MPTDYILRTRTEHGGTSISVATPVQVFRRAQVTAWPGVIVTLMAADGTSDTVEEFRLLVFERFEKGFSE